MKIWETTNAPIRTLTIFTLDSIRKKLWNKFNTGQRKFLMLMTSAPGNEGVRNFVSNEEGNITDANLQ